VLFLTLFEFLKLWKTRSFLLKNKFFSGDIFGESQKNRSLSFIFEEDFFLQPEKS
jgi:hypothetical protein